MEYTAGRGTTALGIVGTVLGGTALAGGGNGILGNLFGGNTCACGDNMPVNRYELNLTNELAAKDAKIGLLESNIYTDSKITDTYAALNGQINALAAEVRANKDAQNGINLQQAVFNGTNTAALNCLQSQVAQLYSLTKLVVPATNICPQPTTTTTTAG